MTDAPFDPDADPQQQPAISEQEPPPGLLGQVIRLCHAANLARRHLDQTVLREARLTWTSYDLLQLVVTRQPIDTRTIAAVSGIAKSTVTVVARDLATRKLLWRSVDGAGDQRHVVLHPTPAAWPLLLDIQEQLLDQLTAFTATAPQDETAAILRHLLLNPIPTASA